jgi:hypothetical protein
MAAVFQRRHLFQLLVFSLLVGRILAQGILHATPTPTQELPLADVGVYSYISHRKRLNQAGNAGHASTRC